MAEFFTQNPPKEEAWKRKKKVMKWNLQMYADANHVSVSCKEEVYFVVYC